MSYFFILKYDIISEAVDKVAIFYFWRLTYAQKKLRKSLIVLIVVSLLSYFFPHYDCTVYSDEISEGSLENETSGSDYSLARPLSFINIV